MSLRSQSAGEASLLAWLAKPLAERNADFDVNSAVEDSAAMVNRRNRLSEAYRAHRDAALDIPYAGHSSNCAFDLYPADEPTAPCLVFIHGGWWQRNGRQNFACYADGLAQCGWSVAMPGYKLAPAASLSGIVDEIGMALDWLVAEGPRYKVAGPLILAGWSAGAHLAAIWLSHPRVAAGLAIAGLYELDRFRSTSFNDAVRLTDNEVQTLSPLTRKLVVKPMTIAVGTNELPLLVSGAEAFQARRLAVDPDGVFLAMADENHFSILDGLLTPDGALVRAAQKLASRINV